MAEFESDQVLVERAKSGDVKAFDFLVIKYQRRVIRLLSRIVRDSSEVEDIAQESFLKAYKAISKFRGDSAFYTQTTYWNRTIKRASKSFCIFSVRDCSQITVKC